MVGLLGLPLRRRDSRRDGMFRADVVYISQDDALEATRHAGQDLTVRSVDEDSQSSLWMHAGVVSKANDQVSERTIGERIRHGMNRLLLTTRTSSVRLRYGGTDDSLDDDPSLLGRQSIRDRDPRPHWPLFQQLQQPLDHLRIDVVVETQWLLLLRRGLHLFRGNVGFREWDRSRNPRPRSVDAREAKGIVSSDGSSSSSDRLGVARPFETIAERQEQVGRWGGARRTCRE